MYSEVVAAAQDAVLDPCVVKQQQLTGLYWSLSPPAPSARGCITLPELSARAVNSQTSAVCLTVGNKHFFLGLQF